MRSVSLEPVFPMEASEERQEAVSRATAAGMMQDEDEDEDEHEEGQQRQAPWRGAAGRFHVTCFDMCFYMWSMRMRMRTRMSTRRGSSDRLLGGELQVVFMLQVFICVFKCGA